MPLSEIKCDHPGCRDTDTKPKFTKRLVDIVGNTRGWRNANSQPRYYCRKHWKLHRGVSPTTGEQMVRSHKSYELVDGKLVPLKGGDVYARRKAS